MYSLVIGVIMVLCILLVLVILAQNAKGGGLASQFGGSAASNIIGVKKTGDLLEKLTWGFVIGIMVFSLLTNIMLSNQSGAPSDILDQAGEQIPVPPGGNLNVEPEFSDEPADTTE